ncbi:MAG TPA: hypothetical protein P5048_00915 [Chlamydiales bacterium]|nr:hypothetical protein [Chlamydiales bacterium]
MHTKSIDTALEAYFETSQENISFTFLKQLCLSILNAGIQSSDSETVQLTLMGAGLSASKESLDILSKGIEKKEPHHQIASLHFLAGLQDDQIDQMLLKAMRSDYLPVRLEACFYMAQRKHPHAIGHITALMERIPRQFRPFFPQFFTIMNTYETNNILKAMLNDIDPNVRLETILSITGSRKDDFLPLLKQKKVVATIAEKEALCHAFGVFNDLSSIPFLKKEAENKQEMIALSAMISLYHLGDESIKTKIIQEALNENPFAIAALGEIEGTEPVLRSLLSSQNLKTQINAAIALLDKKDTACLPLISEILIANEKDYGLQPHYSIGRSLMCWNIYPSFQRMLSKNPQEAAQISLMMKSVLLKKIMELPQPQFIQLVDQIFLKNQKDIVPLALQLLENIQSDEAFALLEKYKKSVGSPFIRDYCHLSLFRINKDPNSRKYLYDWLKRETHTQFIQPKEKLLKSVQVANSNYELTMQEESSILIEIINALVEDQQEETLKVLVEILCKGHPKNRFAIAGLLIRSLH